MYSPKLQHYWNLTIRLFSVIYRILVGVVLPLCRDVVRVFYSVSRLGKEIVCVSLCVCVSVYICMYACEYVLITDKQSEQI